ncbi:hypothetical protein E2562_017213 [Oryza meyeriana var. granulata]|uniref:Uncharacterized protein n=1 Tax=Oryza meyeriana var. granulata TaxID=110450 RepID=A0A6G1ELD7_9ORYZ|nr:hypothetical protein E2562_017213 [Oryza meyeriana var. granulata]
MAGGNSRSGTYVQAPEEASPTKRRTSAASARRCSPARAESVHRVCGVSSLPPTFRSSVPTLDKRALLATSARAPTPDARAAAFASFNCICSASSPALQPPGGLGLLRRPRPDQRALLATSARPCTSLNRLCSDFYPAEQTPRAEDQVAGAGPRPTFSACQRLGAVRLPPCPGRCSIPTKLRCSLPACKLFQSKNSICGTVGPPGVLESWIKIVGRGGVPAEGYRLEEEATGEERCRVGPPGRRGH